MTSPLSSDESGPDSLLLEETLFSLLLSSLPLEILLGKLSHTSI